LKCLLIRFFSSYQLARRGLDGWVEKKADKFTRWETRRNTLETLRKIFKSIMLNNLQVIQHEVMKGGKTLVEVAEDMVTLAEGMTEKERQKYDDEALLEKLVELKEYCEWETYMPGLRRLLDVFGEKTKPIAANPTTGKKGGVLAVIKFGWGE
jgi:hypothetical protein